MIASEVVDTLGPIHSGKTVRGETKIEQDEQTDDQRPSIHSVEIGAEILRTLATYGRSVPLRSLAVRCGMPVGKVHRYLVSLARADLVEQDAASGYYSW